MLIIEASGKTKIYLAVTEAIVAIAAMVTTVTSHFSFSL